MFCHSTHPRIPNVLQQQALLTQRSIWLLYCRKNKVARRDFSGVLKRNAMLQKAIIPEPKAN